MIFHISNIPRLPPSAPSALIFSLLTLLICFARDVLVCGSGINLVNQGRGGAELGFGQDGGRLLGGGGQAYPVLVFAWTCCC